jgi:hypothetical protein
MISKYIRRIFIAINADTTALERRIYNLVYRLYNLTWEEVKVVEPEFPMSKAEWSMRGLKE